MNKFEYQEAVNAPKSRCMSTMQLCNYLGISYAIFQGLRKQNRLPAHVKLGVKRILFVQDTVDKWLKDQETSG